MDEKVFRVRVSRLEEIGALVGKLPAEVRSQAFALLSGYVSAQGNEQVAEPDKTDVDSAGEHAGGREEFFAAFDHEKPADNVKLLAAYLFREHGSLPFKTEEIQSLADDVGITVPNRIDMTIRSAMDDGKKLFVSAGRGSFKPTVHGEAYLKKEYKIRKGNRPKAPSPSQ